MSNQQQTAYDHYWTARGPSKHKYRFNVLSEWVAPGSMVLDVGCGDGYLAAFIRDCKKCTVSGLDVSSVAVQRARERGISAVQGDLEARLPFDDGQFDYVIASEVIEHIIHSEELVREMVRISCSDILLTIPNSAFWKYRLSLMLGRFPKQWIVYPYEHVRFWSVSDFKNTLRSLGLRLVEVRAGSGRRWLRDIWPSMFAEQVCYRIKK
jgi:methionine biosynthesis protein MetW